MPVIDPLVAGYTLAVILGIGTLLFGGRALSILRRPPTGEAARELVFLTARDLVPPFGLLLLVLCVEWIEWIVSGLRAIDLVSMTSFTFYANIAQAVLILVAGVMAYRVLVPYTRSQRTERARVMLDRLAARVALLRGRK